MLVGRWKDYFCRNISSGVKAKNANKKGAVQIMDSTFYDQNNAGMELIL